MLEISAAQSLIARITGIGRASAVFTYYLVKLLVKPFTDVRLNSNPYREFATNVAKAVFAVLRIHRAANNRRRLSPRRSAHPGSPAHGHLLLGRAESIISASYDPLDHPPAKSYDPLDNLPDW